VQVLWLNFEESGCPTQPIAAPFHVQHAGIGVAVLERARRGYIYVHGVAEQTGPFGLKPDGGRRPKRRLSQCPLTSG